MVIKITYKKSKKTRRVGVLSTLPNLPKQSTDFYPLGYNGYYFSAVNGLCRPAPPDRGEI